EKDQKSEELIIRCNVTPQMTNVIGTLSHGVFTTIVTESGKRAVREMKKNGDVIVENITIYFVQPVQIDDVIEIKPRVLELGRKFGKVDV
ncbi:hypothetical protein C1X30_32835, partial [Pseudomonas sp. FW305-BF6]|uniref:hotdog domain-containing protein n=1 Tax=Pseudomonas sp. FW305-BF6 TaxID=2070673 RepID=UPI000CC6BDA6